MSLSNLIKNVLQHFLIILTKNIAKTFFIKEFNKKTDFARFLIVLIKTL
jgi:hypothetical protein